MINDLSKCRKQWYHFYFEPVTSVGKYQLYILAINVPDDEECEELQEEIQQLELRLKEKQDELFQLQRNSYRHKASPIKETDESFVRPQVTYIFCILYRLKVI